MKRDREKRLYFHISNLVSLRSISPRFVRHTSQGHLSEILYKWTNKAMHRVYSNQNKSIWYGNVQHMQWHASAKKLFALHYKHPPRCTTTLCDTTVQYILASASHSKERNMSEKGNTSSRITSLLHNVSTQAVYVQIHF